MQILRCVRESPGGEGIFNPTPGPYREESSGQPYVGLRPPKRMLFCNKAVFLVTRLPPKVAGACRPEK